MQFFGRFTQYTPETLPQGMPAAMRDRVMWLRNEAGEDLYELRKRLPAGHSYLTADDDGHIRVIHDDPNHVWPANGGSLYATTEVLPRDPMVLATKLLDHATRSIVDKPTPVPAAVSKAQAQMALFNSGLLDRVETIVRDHPYRPVRIWYEGANEWRRDNPYVMALASDLGLDEAAVDALFIAAAKL